MTLDARELYQQMTDDADFANQDFSGVINYLALVGDQPATRFQAVR